jgi:phosphatidylserine/phosphatidylglycerophosphate/cardiolipin synthase-like enzyme
VLLLQDGAPTYRAMFAAIGAATDHINLETYKIEDDEIGRQLSELLLQKRAQGVQVNLLYDSVGSIGTPQAFFDRLTAGDVQVLEFNPVNPLSAKKEWLVNNRDHRKLLVIDGHTAFVGGINFSRVHSGGSFARREGPEAKAAWRDTHLRIEGPVVDEFQKLFMQTWAKQRGPPLAAANYFPALAGKGGEMVRAVGSTPEDPHSLIYLTLLSAISKAESHVYLTNAYFVPDPQLLDALTDAARRGGRRQAGAARQIGREHRIPCRALALFDPAARRREDLRAARRDAARQDRDHRRRLVVRRLDQSRLAQLSPQRRARRHDPGAGVCRPDAGSLRRRSRGVGSHRPGALEREALRS